MPVPYPQASFRAPRTSYKNIAAVFIHFEDDDIGCDGLEKELADTFRTFYGITDITHILIKNQCPYGQITMTADALEKRGCTTEDSLVILVFSGYGVLRYKWDFMGEPQYTTKIGGAYNDDGSFYTEVDWMMETSILSAKQCDVLYIMNCAYVPSDLKPGKDAEILAAAGSTFRLSAEACKCFMKALIHEFRRLSSRPFTISTLYTELVKNQENLGLQLTSFYCKRFYRESIIFNNSRRVPVSSSVANTLYRAGRSEVTRKFYPPSSS